MFLGYFRPKSVLKGFDVAIVVKEPEPLLLKKTFLSTGMVISIADRYNLVSVSTLKLLPECP